MTRFVALTVLFFATSTAYAGDKKPNETCVADSDCRRGHCYTKKSDGQKVCVDCSSSTIERTRALNQQWCKEPPRSCDDMQSTPEASERFFTSRIEAGNRCVEAREEENRQCWDGGDEGHRDALKEAEIARRKCYDEYNTRKGTGMVYTCSDSTFNSNSQDVERYCESNQDRACEKWSRDSYAVDCREIENVMNEVDKCVRSVENLQSACLPRLNRYRESKWEKAKKGYDYCKEVLSYKKNANACK